MNYLSNDVKTINSREVAEMLEKEHKYVLRDIEGTDKIVGILPVLESANLHSQDYFIPSTYKAGTREYKCYLVTKMGCEMLANKLTGEKGILFTAKYVEKFNAMEDYVTKQSVNSLQAIEQTLTPLLDKFSDMQNQITNMQNQLNEMAPKSALHDFISYLNLFNYSTFYISRIASLYNLEAKEMNKLLNRVGLLNGYSGNWIPGSKVKERHLHIYQQKDKRVMKWTLEGAVLIYMELEKQLGLLPTKEVVKLG